MVEKRQAKRIGSEHRTTRRRADWRRRTQDDGIQRLISAKHREARILAAEGDQGCGDASISPNLVSSEYIAMAARANTMNTTHFTKLCLYCNTVRPAFSS